MESVQEHKEGSAIELSGDLPGGVHIGAKLRDRVSVTEVLLILLIFLQGGAIGYNSWSFGVQEADRDRRYVELNKNMAMIAVQMVKSNEAHTVIIDTVGAVAKEAKNQTYILALDPAQRRQYNLMEPDDLRMRRR